MNIRDLDKLIIEHLADIEHAAIRIREIEKTIAKSMDSIAEKWIKRHDWRGLTNWSTDSIWVAPAEWAVNVEGDEWRGRFWLGYGYNDNGEAGEGYDTYWLSRLCRAGQGQVCFRLEQNVVKRNIWRKYIQANAEPFQAAGFILDDEPTLLLPFQIDEAELGAAYLDDDIESALQQFERSFDLLLEAKPKFDNLFSELAQLPGKI